MKGKQLPVPRTIAAAAAATVLIGVFLPTAPGPANAEPDDREHDSSSATGVSDSAFYGLGGRVVAVRRDPVPRGAYGGQGVDYSPDMTTWVIGSRCAQ